MSGHNDERGFTLVELLVTVVVMSIVIIGVTAGLITVLNTYPSDITRLTQDEGSQLLSSWLQADVLSAANLDASGGSSSCAGGPTKLKLKWSDFDGAHAFESSYALAGKTLTRYFCIDGGVASPTTVGRNVQTATATVSGQRVSFVVTDLVAGSTYTFTVAASGRTPPTTTTSTTSTSTTSTSTTTTTIPPTTTTTPVCMITNASMDHSSVALAKGGSGHLSQDITLTVTTTGPCGPLTYSVNTGSGVQTNALAQCSNPCSGTTWTGFIAANSFRWTAGSHPFSVLQGTPPVTVAGSPNPVPFTVTP